MNQPLEFKFERPGTWCRYVWTIRFWPMLGPWRYKVTCNGAGNIFTQHASRTKAKRMLGRFLNWACFEEANTDSQVAAEQERLYARLP